MSGQFGEASGRVLLASPNLSRDTELMFLGSLADELLTAFAQRQRYSSLVCVDQ